jgi:hypothetical protein
MLRSPAFVTTFVTVYLVIYTDLLHTGAPSGITTLLFALSPFFVVWMAITIMKYGKYTGPELKEDEEWGYQDVNKRKN